MLCGCINTKEPYGETTNIVGGVGQQMGLGQTEETSVPIQAETDNQETVATNTTNYDKAELPEMENEKPDDSSFEALETTEEEQRTTENSEIQTTTGEIEDREPSENYESGVISGSWS